MADPCPRCGAEGGPLGPCPECGYEPSHPGILGAYRRAATRLARNPRLLVPFLLPAALLLGAELVLATLPPGALPPHVEVPSTVLALLVVATWYFEAIALATSALDRSSGFPSWPAPNVHRASLVGAALLTAPWAAVVALVAWAPQGTLGGLALLTVFVLLIVGVFVAGRAVGFPVHAALTPSTGRDVLAGGNRRARELGGLGLVFLGFVLLAVPVVALAILEGLALLSLSPAAAAALQGALRWLIGAWIGVAIAVGLSGGDRGVEHAFECPVCGRQATVEDGRARCECGLEGPFYEA